MLENMQQTCTYEISRNSHYAQPKNLKFDSPPEKQQKKTFTLLFYRKNEGCIRLWTDQEELSR